MKRLPEACCRGGSPPGFSKPRCPWRTQQNSRGAVTETRDTQRGCRETQRQASSLGQALKAASVQQRNQVWLLPKDECLQVFTNRRLQTGLPGDGCAVCEVKESLLDSIGSPQLHWKRTWAWVLVARYPPSRWPSLQRATTVSSRRQSSQPPLDECLGSSFVSLFSNG